MCKSSGQPQTSQKQKVQTLSDITNSDLTAQRNEYFYETPVLSAMLKRHLNDQRDAPMVDLILNVIAYFLVVIPLMFYLSLSTSPRLRSCCHIVGILNVLLHYLGLLPRFLLMLHYASHKPAFKSRSLNMLLLWVLPPLFGMPCGVYKPHHCTMHHIENNHGLDISATDFYQRDSALHFLCYWFRFTFLIGFELPLYTIRTRRWQWLNQILLGIFLWLSVIRLGYLVSPLATRWLLVVPFFTCFFALSFGNWSQHMFVNPENSRSNYQLTYNCIDAYANRKTFNDGYHVVHHNIPGLHWSEMPTYFHKNIAKHHDHDAITFRYLDFFEVGIHVMCGQLERLARRYYVHLGDKETAPTVDEMVEKFSSWLKPVTVVEDRSKQN